jgi:hypothetical protein
MYRFSLTQGERSAFDFIGNRYSTGNAVKRHLLNCLDEDRNGESAEWDDNGDLWFAVPDDVAFEIAALSDEEDNLWPCFSKDLKAKMMGMVEEFV